MLQTLQPARGRKQSCRCTLSPWSSCHSPASPAWPPLSQGTHCSCRSGSRPPPCRSGWRVSLSGRPRAQGSGWCYRLQRREGASGICLPPWPECHPYGGSPEILSGGGLWQGVGSRSGARCPRDEASGQLRPHRSPHFGALLPASPAPPAPAKGSPQWYWGQHWPVCRASGTGTWPDSGQVGAGGQAWGRQLMVRVLPSQVHSWQSTLTVWPGCQGRDKRAHGHGQRGRNPRLGACKWSPEVWVQLRLMRAWRQEAVLHAVALQGWVGGVPGKMGCTGPRAVHGGPDSCQRTPAALLPIL